jgi:integrase
MRVDELARLGLDDIERGTNTITIRNPKGGESKARQVAIPADLRKISPRLPSPLEALNAYKRVRGDRRQAIDTDALWIGDKGPWTTNGIRLMLRRACQQAGVAPFTPHRFRHTWAHWAKVLGMQHGDLKVVGGWSSDAMVDRYGRSEAQARALDVHRQVFSGD